MRQQHVYLSVSLKCVDFLAKWDLNVFFARSEIPSIEQVVADYHELNVSRRKVKEWPVKVERKRAGLLATFGIRPLTGLGTFSY